MNSNTNTYTINFNKTISDSEINRRIIKHLSKDDNEYYYVRHKKMNKNDEKYERHKDHVNSYIKNKCKNDEIFHEKIKSQNREKAKRFYEKKKKEEFFK